MLMLLIAFAQSTNPVVQQLDLAHQSYDRCVQAETVRLGSGNSESADTILRAVRVQCATQWQQLIDAWPIPNWKALSGWRDQSEDAAVAALLEARAKRP